MTGALLLFVIAGEVSGAHRNFNHIQPTDICEKVSQPGRRPKVGKGALQDQY